MTVLTALLILIAIIMVLLFLAFVGTIAASKYNSNDYSRGNYGKDKK